jgi:hypothetical protein
MLASEFLVSLEMKVWRLCLKMLFREVDPHTPSDRNLTASSRDPSRQDFYLVVRSHTKALRSGWPWTVAERPNH